ncbi:MAG TPA: hypothetical protein VF118_16060 [Gemmatimonadaceae bacterium]
MGRSVADGRRASVWWRATGTRRRIIACSIAAATFLNFTSGWTPSLAAQTSEPSAAPRSSRTKIYTILGAILGGAIGLGIRHSSGGKSAGVVVGSTLVGAGIGFAFGHEADRTYNSRYRGVVPLHLQSVDAHLEGEPVALSADDSLIAVGGSSGVEMLPLSGAMEAGILRARGINSIMAVALAPTTGWLAVGSPAGLYMFPPDVGPGALVRPGDIGAIAGGQRQVYVAVNDRIEIAPLSDDTARAWPGLTMGSPVHALMLDPDHGLLWATTDRNLIALRTSSDSLVRIGEAPLDAVGLHLAQTGDTIAVALGERGVQLFDVTDPRAPRPVASWTTAHFAYDVSIDKQRLFVAAGPEGVYVVDLSTNPMRTLGLARELGFATALASRRGYTYILDRRGVVLRRVLSDF